MPHTDFDTAIGTCRITWHDSGLIGFRLPDDAGTEASTVMTPPPSWVTDIVTRVQQHLQGHLQDFSALPYDFSLVAEFAREVYRATLKVKAGQTCSYGAIARQLGQPAAAGRAVGAALGANPWPLLVPCHRVVASNGHLTGFSGPGGIKTKLRLLALEGAQLFAE